ncbi:hypothetical protein CHS0354_022201 [Potamilus streckersoni]|uniref:Uncharacterized protein n=1 Tax=Potamilus streckersoni TaxID=2493646 RepID=A0AAE0WE77_9BIVA|nr:hypothetical protein CHS0354_022201 [Potamilus streckersoni]
MNVSYSSSRKSWVGEVWHINVVSNTFVIYTPELQQDEKACYIAATGLPSILSLSKGTIKCTAYQQRNNQVYEQRDDQSYCLAATGRPNILPSGNGTTKYSTERQRDDQVCYRATTG